MMRQLGKNIVLMVILGQLLIFGLSVCACSQGIDFVECKYPIDYTKDIFSKVNVLESNQTCSILDIYIYKLCNEKKQVDMVDYDVLTLPDYAYTDEIGKPQLPVIREVLAIPVGSSVNAKILEYNSSTYKNFKIYPVQPPQPDDVNESSSKDATSFAIDREFYTQNAFYPSDTVKIGTPGTWRDLAIINLEFSPTSFNPATGELNAISHIRIALEYKRNITAEKELNVSRETIDPTFDKMYKRSILNYDLIEKDVLQTNLSSNISDSVKEARNLTDVGIDNEIDAAPVILSIRHDDHSTYNATKPLLDWHANNDQAYIAWYFKTGVQVTDTKIKDLIAARYAEYPSLKYVIIWGDISFMPWHLADSAVTSGDKIPGDYWYSLLAGDDLYPEVAVGRMSVDGDAEIQNVVTKTLSYLNTPEEWWSDNVLLVAHKEGAPYQFQGNQETIRSTSYNYPLVFSHLYGASAASGGDIATNKMVNDAINNRVRIVNYRGHGGMTCWCSAWNTANEDYTTANAASLTNTINPVIFAICCQTAHLDYSSQTLSEAFTKPLSNGAVAYYGASRVSWRTPNDWMDIYIFDAIGNLNIREIGLITDYAKVRTLTRDSSAYTKDGLNMYLWLGDPTLPIKDYTVTKPTMTNDGAASGIGYTVATVGAQITSTGGENPHLYIGWGTSDASTGSWPNNKDLEIQGVGTYPADLSGLTPGTQYYYRCYATNSGGTGWASSTATFNTSMIVPVVRGLDKGAWYNTWDGTSWSNWQNLGGQLDLVTATSSGNDVYAFVRGLDKALYYKKWDGTSSSWSNWQYLGGQLDLVAATS